jgi:regulator of protease activity HflC (stomatin/prohibitin superfamily)
MLCTIFLQGCRKPFDVPEFVTIEPSQTAYLIPLVGDSSQQGFFESEDLLLSSKVATKEIRIPHRWVQTGRRSWSGKWKQSARVIIVERKPVTREWTADRSTGTNSRNEGIKAESKGSISFSVSMNASAQIDETNATKFLYRYNNKNLASVMDTEIRAMVESKFVEECAKLEMDQILSNKETIMNNIRDNVIPYFKNRGVTITVLGLKGDIVYDDTKIQESINEKFKAKRLQEAQFVKNKTNIERTNAEATQKLNLAKGEANALLAKAKAQAEANRLLSESITPTLVKYEQIKCWDGKLPRISGNKDMMLLVDDKG